MRILLVDDSALARGILKVGLEQAGFQVVGLASNGQTGYELARDLVPDVVIMDINMPETNGIDATVEIKARHPDVAVIGLSVHNTAEARKAMLQAGATTLLSKESAVDELYAAIRQALADEGVPR